MTFEAWVAVRAAAAESASSGRFACHVVDLVDGREAGWAADIVRPAASLVKVCILLDLLVRAEQGEFSLDERMSLRARDKVGGAGVLTELHEGLELTLHDLAVLMIVVSDNTASNMLIDRLGMERINERIAAMGMGATVLGRKFMIDPNALHAKNFTTAGDMARALARLERGELSSEAVRAQALGILLRQQYREKIPLLLPPNVPVANKTGEISAHRHDVALVRSNRPYVLACLTWDLTDELAGDRAIAQFSRDLYGHLGDGPRATEGELLC